MGNDDNETNCIFSQKSVGDWCNSMWTFTENHTSRGVTLRYVTLEIVHRAVCDSLSDKSHRIHIITDRFL